MEFAVTHKTRKLKPRNTQKTRNKTGLPVGRVPSHGGQNVPITFSAIQQRRLSQSQRDCIIQPRVVPSAGLPWVTSPIILSNPNGVAGETKHRTSNAQHRMPENGKRGKFHGPIPVLCQ
jgi:hypothetical protein